MNRGRFLFFVIPLVLVAGMLVSYYVYTTQRDDLVRAASANLSVASKSFVRALNDIFQPALQVSHTFRDSGIQDVSDEGLADLFSALSVGPVREFEQINGVFVGFPDGRFYHVQDLPIALYSDPGKQAKWEKKVRRRIISHPDTDQRGNWAQFEPSLRKWYPSVLLPKKYDPRSRPWYNDAIEQNGSIWTEPYRFASSGVLGVTFARPIKSRLGGDWAVLGVDMSLESLSKVLLQTSESLAGAANVVFATDLASQILGHPNFVDKGSDAYSIDPKQFKNYKDAESFESAALRVLDTYDEVKMVEAGGRTYLAVKTMLSADNAMPLTVYIGRDLDKVLQVAVKTVWRNVGLVFFAVVVFGVIALYAAKLKVEVGARLRAEEELIEAKNVAEDATRAKSIFLATMSHEIRTPMNGITSMSELLGLSRLDAEQRNMLKIVKDSAFSLLTIINDILDFSKIEAGKLDIENVEFSLMDVVNGSAELMAARAEEKSLDLLVDIDPSLIDKRNGDPTRIRQILLNLASNAVKFTEAGTVGFKVRALDDRANRLRFEVSDTGIGLTEEQQAKLFQAFVQADTSTARKFGGTGLGLSICEKLSELMGGSIGVESVIGEGSVFWFELPLDPIGDSLPQYKHDIAGASVGLVGLNPAVEKIAVGYLRAGGVEETANYASLEETDGAAPDLWIVDCATPDFSEPAVLGLGGELSIIGRRNELAELPNPLKNAASTILTKPLPQPAIWRAVAVALGLEEADVAESDDREDMAFEAPDVEAARAASAVILVAEDNKTNQTVIRQLLDRMGFACEIADNGKIALDMLATPGYGLLLADFNMPEMDGLELARAIRADETDTRLPIIALTADALAEAENACMEAGMDGFLTKPVDSLKLGRTLAQYLPHALELRVPKSEDAAIEEAAPGINWDREIFDPDVLAGPGGKLDQEAIDIVVDAASTWAEKITSFQDALAAGDAKLARDIIHSLKGASLSVGANRIGRNASDIQDALDSGDLDFASILSEILMPNFEELEEIIPQIQQL